MFEKIGAFFESEQEKVPKVMLKVVCLLDYICGSLICKVDALNDKFKSLSYVIKNSSGSCFWGLNDKQIDGFDDKFLQWAFFIVNKIKESDQIYTSNYQETILKQKVFSEDEVSLIVDSLVELKFKEFVKNNI